MASNPKTSGESGLGKEPLAFEEALHRLEGVVERMETGELPLDQLLQQFEEGTRLVKICQGKLEEAELKIQKLEKTVGGELVLKPMKLTNADE